MPTVQMPDGTNVQMPDKPSMEQLNRLRKLRMTQTAGGKRMGGAPSGGRDYPALPFMDRTIVAAMEGRKDEISAFLERKYGKGSVSSDKRGLVVAAGDQKMRVNTGFLAEVTSQAPETALGIAGAMAGSEGGPLGSIAGAAAGSMAGRGIKEAVKSATGVQRESPKEVAESVGMAGVAGAVGEGATRVLKAPVSRLTRGPLPGFITDTTPESRAMTERTLAGGARPPPQSTMPSAMRIQRIAIIADKISGPNRNIEAANTGYLVNRASGILDRAGVRGAAKDETMQRLTTSGQTAMSFADTGRLIQNNAKFMLSQAKGKTKAYLKQVSTVGKTPEDAYSWLVAPGQQDRLERFVKIMGNGSAVVEAVRQRSLRHLLAGAMERAESGEATGALDKELSQFTTKQQKLLFPGGLVDDLRLFAKETQFLFPSAKDPGMAGFQAGQVMGSKNITKRWYNQAYYSLFRAFLQKPEMIRRLAIGFKGDSVQRIAARSALREMLYFGALEGTQPSQDPSPETANEGARSR